MKINKKYIFDFNVIENPTPEFAYYLGWMWGDGTCRHRVNGYGQSLEIQELDGLEIVNFFETFCKPSKKFRHRKGRKPTISINLYDFILGKFLEENDYEKKSQKPPTKILNFLPIELHEYWFRGFFEADGHASFREQTIKGYMASVIEFYAPFNQNWDFLREYLFKSGIEIKTATRQRLSGNSSCASISKQDYIIKFTNCVYANKISMSLSRKYKTLMEMKNYIVNGPPSKSKELQSKSS
jgi:hypothetical protein